MKKVLAILALAAFAAFVEPQAKAAETFFVAENQLGTGDGSSTNNAHSRAWFNTSGNWANPKTSGKIGPGDTVDFFGVLTNGIACFASGSTGSRITLQVLTTNTTPAVTVNAQFTAPTIGDGNYWVNFNGKDWITLDGGGDTNSFTFQCTSNYSGGPFTNSCGGLYYGGSTPVHHITVQNLGVRNLYVRKSNSHLDTYPATIGTYLIGSDLTLSNAAICEAVSAIGLSWTGSEVSSNWTLVNLFTTNVNHALEMGYGTGSAAYVLNVTVDRCALTLGDMWETETGFDIGLHRNPFFVFNSNATGGYMSNIVVRRTLIKSGTNPGATAAGTAGMFWDLTEAQIINVKVYNNLSITVAPLAYSGGQGFLGAGGGLGWVLYNTCLSILPNGTVVSTNSAGAIALITEGPIGGYMYGNIVGAANQTVQMYVTDPAIPDSPTDTQVSNGYRNCWSDYNIFIGTGFPGYDQWAANTNGHSWRWFSGSLSQWQVGGTGGRPSDGGLLTPNFDPHSTTTLPTFNGGYFPTANALSGTNLTSWGITDDFYGQARPSSGNWMVGAVQSDPTGGGGGGTTGGTGGGGSTVGAEVLATEKYARRR